MTHPTPDGDALFAAVLATPDDDTVRLVYADYLEEHGDPARAEFVRVQVEVARHDPITCPTCGHRPDMMCNTCLLPAREIELLEANEARWRSAGACPKCAGTGALTYGGVPCSDCGETGDVGALCTGFVSHAVAAGLHSAWVYGVDFRRGFVDTIRAAAADVFRRVQVYPDSLAYRGDQDWYTDWRPAPRAIAWAKHFPTLTRVVLTDCAPDGPNPAESPGLSGRETWDWWPGSLGYADDFTIPRSVSLELAAKYPDQHTRGGMGVEFPSPEAAVDAAAVAAAAVIKAAVR